MMRFHETVKKAILGLAVLGLFLGATAARAETVPLLGFNVAYEGRTYDATGNQTTFTYTVTGTGAGTLDSFTLGLPICGNPLVLEGYSPAGATIGEEPNTFILGITWNQSLGANDTQTYSLVYEDNILEGSVDVAVVRGSTSEQGFITGPSCQRGTPPNCELTPVTVSLCAGQFTDVGSVVITNNATKLFVKVQLDAAGWELTESHVAAATSLAGIPASKKGNPKIGNFPYSSPHTGVTSFTYEIPLGDWTAGTQLLIAVHGVVETTGQNETAWGASCPGDVGVGFPGGSWATYFPYTVQTVGVNCSE
ncbi:MAG TPA: hypothetical protein VLQ45_09500 [Thermoanaerobaculia bacterium]|nr:hypothetical protein [Thermoanaerobaculia bacterium]